MKRLKAIHVLTAKSAKPFNGKDERHIRAAVDSPALYDTALNTG